VTVSIVSIGRNGTHSAEPTLGCIHTRSVEPKHLAALIQIKNRPASMSECRRIPEPVPLSLLELDLAGLLKTPLSPSP
jgi:hypothetical protein